MYDVAKARGEGHEHGVDVNFAEEWHGGGNGWRDVDLHGLAKLTLVASVDIPFYVAIKRRPPEAVKEGATCRIEPFVAEAIVGITNEGEMEGWHDAQLVAFIGLSSPKAAIGQGEASGPADKTGEHVTM